jgi:hypothetical protein
MLGKILNGLVEKAVDKWLGSESSKRYAASAIMRGLSLGMLALLAWLVKEHGLSVEVQQAIAGHWDAIVTLLGPVLGVVLVELASKARAKLNAKALEVAVAAPSGALTPVTAKAMATAALKHDKA